MTLYNNSGCCLTASSNKSENNIVDKYLSPNEGIITTIFFPAFSGLSPTVRAAFTAAPEDMPTSKPSLVASKRATSTATVEGT